MTFPPGPPGPPGPPDPHDPRFSPYQPYAPYQQYAPYAPYAPYPPPVMPLETVFARAWELYRRNWIIALPLLITIGLFLVAFGAIVAGAILASPPGGARAGHGAPVSGWLFPSVFLAFVVLFVASLWGHAATFGMANAAWERGTTTFADGNRAFMTRAGALVVAAIGFFGLAIAAMVLALPTLFLSFLALIVFTMYVYPAVIAGRGGFEAISESFGLVRRSFGRSAIGLLLLIALQYALSFAAYPLMIPLMWPLQSAMITGSQAGGMAAIPPPGWFVAMGAVYLIMIVLMLAYYGYYALALVGMYRSLASPEPAENPLVPA